MNTEEIKKIINIFYPAIILNRLVSRRFREGVGKIFGRLAFIFILLVGATKLSVFKIFSEVQFLQSLIRWQDAFLGGFLFFLSLWLFARAFRAFYYSYYFIALRTVMPEIGLSRTDVSLTFESSEILYGAITSGDLTGTFIASDIGQRAFSRLAISKKSLSDFLSARPQIINPDLLKIELRENGNPSGMREVAKLIANSDHEFFKFLSAHSVSLKDFAGASDWMERVEIYFRKRSRFWGKDSLGRVPGLGKDWAYGGAYTLEKFAHDITERSIGGLDDSVNDNVAERDELEAILARTGEANALLIADEGVGALDIVFALGGRISRGSVLPPLEHKRIFLFDTNAFIASAKDKVTFEAQLLHVLSEAVRAGNVILVIADLPSFIQSAKGIGADVVALMDTYLARPDFQVIAMANPGAFHEGVEGDSKILHRFEKIQIKERDESATMRVLEDRALIEESRAGVFFTYQSLSAVAESAKRYLAEGVVSDKSLHLLAEVVPAILAKKKRVVERSDILSLVETKTGIPTGEIKDVERQKLLNLETILHQRIIGQEEAVSAISNAMRRARSDIENPDRPMGSFLFLGPTGVGKTETTKALASVFFGNEESVIRLDMSEYQTDDALKRLIGSFEDGKQGVLASKLREQSYGVLLLDEFEKTNKEVLDLFLQILDEGFFSDMSGKRVNARNLIIIATSNAGSDLIWNLQREGKDLTASKDAIIAEIINRGIFKPELLNRFDGVVLFHPLTAENLQVIAGLMLKKLQKRLTEKGIELVINDALMKSVMSAGTDPEFGARPMNRAIQNKVETLVADKILQGNALPGSKIIFTPEELNAVRE